MVPTTRLVVLAGDQIESLNHLLLVQSRGLQHDELSLLLRQCTAAKEMPALDTVRKCDLVLKQPAICFFMVVDKGQESLPRCSLKQVEVILEVIGQLNSLIIGEVAVQDLQNLLERVISLELLEAPVFEEPPNHATEGANYVQHALSCTLGESCLAVVDLDSLTPFTIVGRLA